MQSLVSLSHVTKVYGEGSGRVVAVQDACVDLSPGRLVLLMGPSGSGKTTVVLLMGCLLKPSAGEVRIQGLATSGLGERQLPALRRRHLGFVFQGFNLFPALTALQNVEAALDLKGRRGRAARGEATDLLGRVGLERRLHHRPADLSGGEKQRVAIARALAGDPPIILADEPTGQLDSTAGRAVVTILRSLAEQGRLVFMVSHDARVLDVADQVLRMEDGRLREQ